LIDLLSKKELPYEGSSKAEERDKYDGAFGGSVFG
jgi:hypothetical protein